MQATASNYTINPCLSLRHGLWSTSIDANTRRVRTSASHIGHAIDMPAKPRLPALRIESGHSQSIEKEMDTWSKPLLHFWTPCRIPTERAPHVSTSFGSSCKSPGLHYWPREVVYFRSHNVCGRLPAVQATGCSPHLHMSGRSFHEGLS